MKVGVISLDELIKSNPTLCLSPMRTLKECHKCQHVVLLLHQKPPDQNILKLIEKMRCRPQIRDEILELMKRKEELLRELKEIDRKINQ